MVTNRKAAPIVVGVVLVLSALMFAYPAMAAADLTANDTISTSTISSTSTSGPTVTTTTTTSTTQYTLSTPTPTVTVGETITLTSTQGYFRDYGAKPVDTSPASAVLTLTVAGQVNSQYILVTGGSITLGGNTYSITGGSAQVGTGLTDISGSGTASNGGVFTFEAASHSTIVGDDYISLSISIGAGGITYPAYFVVDATTS